MTKNELIAEVAHRHPQHSLQEIEAAVNAVFATLAQALATGQRIELRDFGSFGLKQHRAHTGRNPKTGAVIAVPAKTVPFFRVAKGLRRRVEQPGVLTQENREGEEQHGERPPQC
jgi:integration host factor subunit beta